MERRSDWIAPGWFVVFCLGCYPYGVPFQDKKLRDEFARIHQQETGHQVDCLNGSEQ